MANNRVKRINFEPQQLCDFARQHIVYEIEMTANGAADWHSSPSC